MNISETAAYIEHLDRFRPDFVTWRDNQAKEMAAAHGTEKGAEVQGMLAAISKEWAEITIDEAMDALNDLYAGRASLPAYFDYAKIGETVRRIVVNGRQARQQAERYESHDGEHRFECLDCRDTGVVIIFNPYFVRDFQETFLALKGSRGAYAAVHKFWSSNCDPKLGALSHAALCDCACPRRQKLSVELEKFKAGQRVRRGESMGPPACGVHVWRRDWSPRYPSGIDSEIYEALAAFYAGKPRQLFGGAA